MHDEGVAVDFGQVRHVAAARRANACQIVTRQVNQHQVFGELLMVGTHFQFNAAVEIAVQGAIGTTAAWAGSRYRVDLNLAAGGVVLEGAFRRRAKQGEIIVLHKEHVRAWVALFKHIVSRQRRRAGQ